MAYQFGYQSQFELNLQEARKAVNEIVQHIETQFRRPYDSFNISEIVEGGSMGHKTTVPGEFDIDLVIYSRDIRGRNIMTSGEWFKPWLRKLHDFLQNTLGRNYRHIRMTKRSVQFNYKEKVDVDLLVSPFWSNRDEFYTFLLREVPSYQRDHFTVCASKWQVEFFRNQPKEVKDFSRIAKKWRNDYWPKGGSGEGRPSSYLMSLLVALAYHEAGPSKTAREVTQALISIVKSDSISYNWRSEYVDKYRSLLPDAPRIVDPANPANNVWYSGFKGYGRGEKPNDYEPGDGNSTILKRYIHTIDLSQAV